MFRVTPVPENRDRKVSFSPDIDESYRHQVVDKIQGLMKEVEVIHGKEERQMQKFQDLERLDFKKKQELDLKAFMKKQQDEASGFQVNQANTWNDLKERHTQETWKLFGRTSTRPEATRPTINNIWGDAGKKQDDSRHSSPCFSPKPASETSNHSWSSVTNSQVGSPTSWPSQSPWSRTHQGTQSQSGAANNRGLDYWH